MKRDMNLITTIISTEINYRHQHYIEELSVVTLTETVGSVFGDPERDTKSVSRSWEM